MGDEQAIVSGFDLGVADYVLKPIAPTDLQARVERVLRSQGADGGA